jgi:hypothetical protein
MKRKWWTLLAAQSSMAASIDDTFRQVGVAVRGAIFVGRA